MTKNEKIVIVYLLIVSTSSLILNLIVLNKKTPPVKAIPIQAEKTTVSPDVNAKVMSATDSASLTVELTAIRNELSMIRANQRGQSQTLGAEDIGNLLQPESSSSSVIGSLTLRSLAGSDVYKEKSNTSIIVGKISYGENYSYFQKQDNWYFLKEEGFQGWISSVYIKEVN